MGMAESSVAGIPSTAADPELAAMVLCGGRSARMGADKALLTTDGSTWIERVAQALVPVAGAGIVIVAASDQALPALGDAKVVLDEGRFEGPLVAISRGATHVPVAARACFVAATDLFRMRAEVARRIASLLQGGEAAVPRIDGRAQWLAAVYSVDALTKATSAVGAGERSMHAFASRLRVRYVDAPELLADPAVAAADPRLESLVDADTPADVR